MTAASERFDVPGADRRALAVDVTRPAEGSRATAVILLHGGGWRHGDRAMMRGYAEALAGHGFVAIAAEYRLLGEAAWPAQLDDVRDVVDWAADNARMLGVDPSRIAVEGFSAGGHLALLAAATSRRVAAVIAFFAPAIMEAPADPALPNPIAALLGPDASDPAIASANPIANVEPGYPPTFLLSGTGDPLAAVEVHLRMMERLRSVGTEVELHLYHGHTHEFSALPSMIGPTQAEVALFLERAVVDPERYRAENLALNMFARGGPPSPDPEKS